MDDVRLELPGCLGQHIAPARDEVSHLGSADSVKDTIGRARLVFIARVVGDIEAAGHRIEAGREATCRFRIVDLDQGQAIVEFRRIAGGIRSLQRARDNQNVMASRGERTGKIAYNLSATSLGIEGGCHQHLEAARFPNHHPVPTPPRCSRSLWPYAKSPNQLRGREREYRGYGLYAW